MESIYQISWTDLLLLHVPLAALEIALAGTAGSRVEANGALRAHTSNAFIGYTIRLS